MYNTNFDFSFCEKWQSSGASGCSLSSAYINQYDSGCNTNSWTMRSGEWRWNRTLQAAVAWFATSNNDTARVAISCGTEALAARVTPVQASYIPGSGDSLYTYNFELSSMYVCPTGSNCGQWLNCNDCTTATSYNCGWCAHSNRCHQGTSSGPRHGSCQSWDWVSSECPAQKAAVEEDIDRPVLKAMHKKPATVNGVKGVRPL